MASPGRGARQKGFQFERDVAKALSEATGRVFKRGLGQTRGGGVETADVIPEDLRLKEFMHIECKRQKTVSIKAAMQQALDDVAGTAKLPIAITKEDRKSALATMRHKDFIQVSLCQSTPVINPDVQITMLFDDFKPIFTNWVRNLEPDEG